MEIIQIMRKAIVVEDDILLKDAAKIMVNKNIGSLIIVSDDKIKGIITEKDIMKNVTNLNSQVNKVMSKKVIEIAPSVNVEDAGDLMISKGIKRLPVVEDKKLIGIITMTDVLAHHEGGFDEEFLFN